MKIIGIIILLLNIAFSGFSQIPSNNYINLTTNDKYIINKMYLDGNLVPIGWSRDGKIAFAQYIGLDLDGLVGPVCESTVKIFDLINDEVIDILYTRLHSLAGNEYETDEILYGLGNRIIRRIKDNDDSGISFQQFWTLFEPEITNMLERHKIISYPNSKFHDINELKINYGLEIYFENFSGKYADSDYGKEYQNIIVKNSGGKTKTIGQVGSFMSGGTVLGYYKSPYENRIVIYIEETGHDIHGFYFYGCHLTAGF
jgi:hypothetical protein